MLLLVGAAESQDVCLEVMPAVAEDKLWAVSVALGLPHLQLTVLDDAPSDALVLPLTFALLHCT